MQDLDAMELYEISNPFNEGIFAIDRSSNSMDFVANRLFEMFIVWISYAYGNSCKHSDKTRAIFGEKFKCDKFKVSKESSNKDISDRECKASLLLLLS
jgi:hypothetical protein